MNGRAALNDECLSHLSEIPGLTSLSIQATTSLTDGATASLGKLKSLQTLILTSEGGPETDAGMANLAGLSNLRKLEIALGAGVSDVGLAPAPTLVQNCNA